MDKIVTAIAVDAYRRMERAALSLDRAEYNLGVILASHKVNMPEYVRQTEVIRADYERKRQALKLSDKLP